MAGPDTISGFNLWVESLEVPAKMMGDLRGCPLENLCSIFRANEDLKVLKVHGRFVTLFQVGHCAPLCHK